MSHPTKGRRKDTARHVWLRINGTWVKCKRAMHFGHRIALVPHSFKG